MADCLIVTPIVLFIMALSIGIPCLVVGLITPSCVSLPFLISIPLCPTADPSTSLSDLYVGSELSDTGCSVDPDPLSVNFSTSIVKDRKWAHHGFLLHNFFAYSITVNVRSGTNRDLVRTLRFERNMNYSDTESYQTPTYSDNSDLMKCLYDGDYVRLFCPYSPTLATQWYNTDPYCQNSDGYPAIIDKQMQRLSLGVFNYGWLNSPIILEFEVLEARPFDFSTPPALFFTSSAEVDRNATIIAGGVFLGIAGVIGIVAIVLSVVIECC